MKFINKSSTFFLCLAFCSLATILCITASAEAQFYGNTSGGLFSDEAFGLDETFPDGGSVIIGPTCSFGNFFPNPPNTHLVVRDVDGTLLNALTYQDSKSWGHDYSIADLINACDPGFVWTTGMFTEQFFGGGNAFQSFDIMVTRTGPLGVPLWTRGWGGQGEDGGTSVICTNDGNIVVAGWTSAPFCGFGCVDIFVAKLDLAGLPIWSFLYGWQGDDKAWSVREDPASGDMIVVGETTSFTVGGGDGEDSDMLVMRLDGATGAPVWASVVGQEWNDIGRAVHIDPQGDVVAVGLSHSTGNNSGDAVVIKLGIAAGAFLAGHSYGGNRFDDVWSLTQSITGDGYVLVGESNSFAAPGFRNGEVFALEVPAALGPEIWSRIYGGPSYDFGRSIRQSRGAPRFPGPLGYYIAGASKSFGAGGGDQLLMRVDLTGDFSVTTGNCNVVINPLSNNWNPTLISTQPAISFCHTFATTSLSFTVGTITSSIWSSASSTATARSDAETPALYRNASFPDQAAEVALGAEARLPWRSSKGGPVEVSVVDAAGAVLRTLSITPDPGSDHIRLSTSGLAPGSYTIRLGKGSRERSHRLRVRRE